MRRTLVWLAMCAAGWGAGLPVLRADGPGSGDVVTTRKLSPKMLRRIWRLSRARRAQERRIRELKSRIATLRAALPELQRQAMLEADRHRQVQGVYQRKRQRFLQRWGRMTRLFDGKSPVKAYTDRYGGFRIQKMFSSDTSDFKRARRRANMGDGDDFLLYAGIRVPQDLVRRNQYAVDWDLSGYDFQGREVSFFRSYHESGSAGFRRIRWTSFLLRRRITGLGLTPGWYGLRATLKVAGKEWLRRTHFALVRITRVNPLISAPPASRKRIRNPRMVKLIRARVRSTNHRRGIDVSRFTVRGRYQVASGLTGRERHLLVGAYVYGADRSGRAVGEPLRVAFRYRSSLRRTRGRFGSSDTTTVKQIDKGLKRGHYVLRVWVLASKGTETYWDYADTPFAVGLGATSGRRASGRRGRR